MLILVVSAFWNRVCGKELSMMSEKQFWRGFSLIADKREKLHTQMWSNENDVGGTAPERGRFSGHRQVSSFSFCKI